METQTLYTVREVAQRIGHPRTRVAHACDVYGITPTRRAGMVKLYSDDQVSAIRAACRRVASRGGRL